MDEYHVLMKCRAYAPLRLAVEFPSDVEMREIMLSWDRRTLVFFWHRFRRRVGVVTTFLLFLYYGLMHARPLVGIRCGGTRVYWPASSTAGTTCNILSVLPHNTAWVIVVVLAPGLIHNNQVGILLAVRYFDSQGFA